MRTVLPLREIMAVPLPRTGAHDLSPMRTRMLETRWYEMKAERSGIMWSVAPVSATTSREGCASMQTESRDREMTSGMGQFGLMVLKRDERAGPTCARQAEA